MVELPRARARDLAVARGEPSAVVRGRTQGAADRLRDSPPRPGAAARELLDRAVDRLHLSARARMRVGRVAVTIAALAGAREVAAEHVAEALSYRAPPELAR
jgi:magnesium chelatase family protein